MTEKPIYAPNYYKKFKCKADKCRHSCCIDWEIDIDESTLKKYKSLNDGISDTIAYDEEGAHFALNGGRRCPHLNEKGLCNIICNHGEDYLSDICRLHPRFFNDVSGRIEAGLGIVCEEACRIILENESSFKLEKTEQSEIKDSAVLSEFIKARDDIILLIDKSDAAFLSKTKLLKDKFNIKTEIYTKLQWINIFSELEILDTEWRCMLENAKTDAKNSAGEEYDKYFSRLLTYFVYRHVSTAENRDALRARLAFSLFSAEFIKYLFECSEEKTKDKLFDIARMYSSEIEYSEDNTAAIIAEFEFECIT